MTTDEGEDVQYRGFGGDDGLWLSRIEPIHQNATDYVLEDIQGSSLYPLTKSRSHYLTGIKLLMKLLWQPWPQDPCVLSKLLKSTTFNFSLSSNSPDQWICAGNLAHCTKHCLCAHDHFCVLNRPQSVCHYWKIHLLSLINSSFPTFFKLLQHIFSNYKLLNCWRRMNNGCE